MPATTGKDAIRAALKGMVTDPALSLKFHASKVDVAQSGDIGYTQGSYTMTMTDPQSKQVINDHGSYVTTYRKQPDGMWKAVADIATSEVPPPAPPPAPAAMTKH
jgi:ketosteroid isomerase-like protein